MAALLGAVQVMITASVELLSAVWMEVAMFACAAVAYFVCTGVHPWKSSSNKKQPSMPSVSRGSKGSRAAVATHTDLRAKDMQPIHKLLFQGKLDEAIAAWAQRSEDVAMPVTLASQFLVTAARLPDTDAVVAILRGITEHLQTDAFDDVLARALQRKDMETCRKVHNIANLLSVPRSSRTFETLAKVHSHNMASLEALVKEAPVPVTKYFAKVVLASCASVQNAGIVAELFEKVNAGDNAELRTFFEATVKSASEGHAVLSASDAVAVARDIRGSGRKGDLDAAIALFDGALPFWKAGGAPAVGAANKGATLLVNGVIDACAECADLERAAEYLSRARALGLADTVSFNTLMKGYLAAGKAEEAESIFAELSQTNAQVTHYSFHGIMNARVALGDRKGAWRCLSDMRAAGIVPNLVTCAILLKTCVASEHSDDVRSVLDAIEKEVEAQDEVLVAAVIEACLRTAQLNELASFLERNAERCVVAPLAAATYGSLIKAFGQAGDVKRVWAFWREMQERKVAPSPITVGCMVEALVRNGHAQGALQLVREVCEDDTQRHLINTVTFSTILKGSRQVDWVLEVYDEMRARDIPCNTITYNTILNVFAENGNMSRAPKLLQDMKSADPKVEPDVVTYSTLIKGFCGAGDLDRALDLFGELKQDKKHSPDEVMYNSLLDGCAKEQRVKDALALVDDMQLRGVAPSNYTLSMLVKLLGRCNMLERAFSMLEQLTKQHGLRLNIPVYTCLIQACFQNRQPARAVALLDQLTEDGLRPDQVLFTALTRGCMQARQTDQAVRMVRRAYETSPPCGVDGRVLDELVRKLGSDSKAAESLLEEVKRKQGQVVSNNRLPRSNAPPGSGASGLAERRAGGTAGRAAIAHPWHSRRTVRTGGW